MGICAKERKGDVSRILGGARLVGQVLHAEYSIRVIFFLRVQEEGVHPLMEG